MRFPFLFLLILFFSPFPLYAQGTGTETETEFSEFLEKVKEEARAEGVSEAVLMMAFKDVKAPDARVIELDRKQPEFNQDFTSYMAALVSEERVLKGRELMKYHRPLLDKIYKEYGVPPNVIVAFWGIESYYGTRKGKLYVIQSMTTLAYDHRRSKFFKGELIAALKILQREERTTETLVGGWAGAMGHFQFIPSTYLAYAVDIDGDGKKDIWDNFEEAAYSAAHFLQKIGWQRGQLWGREVKLPSKFPYPRFFPEVKKPLTFWKEQGIVFPSGKPLGTIVDFEAEVVLPEGRHGPAFLVYDNFRVIRRWNNSTLYALSVGLLSNRIGFREPLIYQKGKYATPPLSGQSVKKMQERLAVLGYYQGTATGILGPVTIRAVQKVQRDLSMTQDGYPTPLFLKRINSKEIDQILEKKKQAEEKKKADADKPKSQTKGKDTSTKPAGQSAKKDAAKPQVQAKMPEPKKEVKPAPEKKTGAADQSQPGAMRATSGSEMVHQTEARELQEQ